MESGIISGVDEISQEEIDFDSLTSQVAEATSLKEGSKGVEAVLRALYQTEPTGVKPLARKVRLPAPVLVAVLGELTRRGAVSRSEGVTLTGQGRRFVQEVLGVHSREQWICQACNGRTVTIPARLRPVVEKMATYGRQAPGVDTSLDQAPSTPESALRRALVMIRQGAVEGKRVLILGDDDCVSLAIGLSGQVLHPGGAFAARIVVLESDPRWVDYLRAVSSQEGLGIEVSQTDLRDPLPEVLRGAFDTFETDPPYTLGGMTLFVSRGVEALAGIAGGQGYLSLGAAPPGELLAYQGALTQMGLVVRELLPNFNVYTGASILAGVSHLYCLETTESAFPAITGPFYEGQIYTGQQNPVLRVYRCMACGQMVKVGQGQAIPTIEKLKNQGCPACGGQRFELAVRILRE